MVAEPLMEGDLVTQRLSRWWGMIPVQVFST